MYNRLAKSGTDFVEDIEEKAEDNQKSVAISGKDNDKNKTDVNSDNVAEHIVQEALIKGATNDQDIYSSRSDLDGLQISKDISKNITFDPVKAVEERLYVSANLNKVEKTKKAQWQDAKRNWQVTVSIRAEPSSAKSENAKNGEDLIEKAKGAMTDVIANLNVKGNFEKNIEQISKIRETLAAGLKPVFTLAAQDVITMDILDYRSFMGAMQKINDDPSPHVAIVHAFNYFFFITNDKELLEHMCEALLCLCKCFESAGIIEAISPFEFYSSGYSGKGYKYEGKKYYYHSIRCLHEDVLGIEESKKQMGIYSQQISLRGFADYLKFEDIKHPILREESKRVMWRSDESMFPPSEAEMPRVAVFPVDLLDGEVFIAQGMACDANKMISSQIINYINTRGGKIGDLVIEFTKDEESDTEKHSYFKIGGVDFHKITGVDIEEKLFTLLGMPLEGGGISKEMQNSQYGFCVREVITGKGYDMIPQISRANSATRNAKMRCSEVNIEQGINHVVDMPLAEYCKVCIEELLRAGHFSGKRELENAQGVLEKLKKMTSPRATLLNVESQVSSSLFVGW